MIRQIALALLVLVPLGLTGWYLLVRRGGPEQGTEVQPVDVAPVEPAPVRRAIGAGVETPSVPRSTGLSREAHEASGRAIALLGAGQLEEAVRAFEECLELHPDERVFQRNLAEALARLAAREQDSDDLERRARAIELLARAVEVDPSRNDLRSLLDRRRKSAAAEEGFWSKKTAHFLLSFDGNRDELLWGTAPLEEGLESAYQEFGELFGQFLAEGGRPRIRVSLYRRESFDAITGLGDWAGGVFDGTVRVPVENLGEELERLKDVLRHELVHAYVHELGGPTVPGWLNEGLAQWLEPSSVATRASHVTRAREKLKGQELFALADLVGSLAQWDDQSAIELAYAQSLAFVDFVARMYGDRELFALVSGCKTGQAPGVTFESRVGIPLTVVLEDLRAEL